MLKMKEVASCRCGCQVIKLWRDRDVLELFYLEFYLNGLSGKYFTWREKIKAIYYFVAGRPYMFNDVVLDREALESFVEKLKVELEAKP